jgi:hypothetical protein
MPTAVVIDGAYFLRRFSATFPNLDSKSPEAIGYAVTYLAAWHLSIRLGPLETLRKMDNDRFRPEETANLYRSRDARESMWCSTL